MTDKKIDLAALDTVARCDQGAELELTHPGTGKPLGIFITLAGVDSRIWRKATAELAEKRLARRGRISGADVAREGIEILAQCTLDWRGVVVDGEELPCIRDTARALYERFPWIFEQADRFASERGSFLQD